MYFYTLLFTYFITASCPESAGISPKTLKEALTTDSQVNTYTRDIYIQLNESHPDPKYSKGLSLFVLILPSQQAWEDLPLLQDCGWRWWALWEIVCEQFLADRWGAVKNPE